MKKLYRICTYEVVGVVDGIERTNLVDIVEAEAEELASGRNVFHLVREIEERIARESEENSL